MAQGGVSRRTFLTGTAALAAAGVMPLFSVLPGDISPNEVFRIGCVGVGQRMLGDLVGGLGGILQDGTARVVAFCDPNDRAGQNDEYARRGWPLLRNEYADVPRFRDWRVMFDKMGGDIDGIYLTTAHHAYFPIIMDAMQRGIHTIGHKPMVVSVEEARVMSQTALGLGNVVTATRPNRRGQSIQQLRQWYDGGAFGEITEVHLAQGFGMVHPLRDAPADPVPDYCDWNAFNACAPGQPFRKEYLEVRGWNQCPRFSCGQAGEWGTHMFVLPHTLLNLDYPESVELVRKDGGDIVEWRFPARGAHPPARVRAYSGHPETFMDKVFPLPEGLEPERRPQGWAGWAHRTVLKGTKASVMCGAYGGQWRVVPETKMQELLKAHGVPGEYPYVTDTRRDFVEACKAGDPGRVASGPEWYGPYLECVMLGLVAWRTDKVGKRLRYDAEAMRITNDEDANRYLRREYRPGYRNWSV